MNVTELKKDKEYYYKTDDSKDNPLKVKYIGPLGQNTYVFEYKVVIKQKVEEEHYVFYYTNTRGRLYFSAEAVENYIFEIENEEKASKNTKTPIGDWENLEKLTSKSPKEYICYRRPGHNEILVCDTVNSTLDMTVYHGINLDTMEGVTVHSQANRKMGLIEVTFKDIDFVTIKTRMPTKTMEAIAPEYRKCTSKDAVADTMVYAKIKELGPLAEQNMKPYGQVISTFSYKKGTKDEIEGVNIKCTSENKLDHLTCLSTKDFKNLYVKEV